MKKKTLASLLNISFITILWSPFLQALPLLPLEEIGADDFRISQAGPDGEDAFKVLNPAIVYNSQDQEYLVVWQSNENPLDPGTLGKSEIYGQRIAQDGTLIDSPFWVSSGLDGPSAIDPRNPDLVYNSDNNEYLVVWRGSRYLIKEISFIEVPYHSGEIQGQRINADGSLKGDLLTISQMAPDNVTQFGADEPALTYNSTQKEYFVVWNGTSHLLEEIVDGEFEIFGRRVDQSGPIGDQIRISTVGPDMKEAYDAYQADIAYNPLDNEYFVVWSGNSTIGYNFGIYGQRLQSDGTLEDEAVALKLGSSGIHTNPKVVYNSTKNGYEITWSTQDEEATASRALDGASIKFIKNSNGITGRVYKSFYQLYSLSGSNPDLVYSPESNACFLVSEGFQGSLGQYQYGIRGKIASIITEDLDNSYSAYYIDQALPISATQDQNGSNWWPTHPAIGYNSDRNEFLVVWQADSKNGSLSGQEFEIYGQLIQVNQEEIDIFVEEQQEKHSDNPTSSPNTASGGCALKPNSQSQKPWIGLFGILFLSLFAVGKRRINKQASF